MKIKTLTTITLFIFWAVVVAILVAGLVFYQNKNLSQNNLNTTNNQLAGNAQTTGTVSQITLNLAEVAKHNLASNCWTVVYNKVYNLTSFLNSHSGGANSILPYCGKDGTLAFETKDGRGAHRQGDLSILANYYVGDLNSKASQQAINQNIQKTNTVPAQNRDREFEDD